MNMNQESYKIGKIKNYQNGAGEIVTQDDTYLFTINDIKDDNISNGDLVKFRAEKVHDNCRAFFVKKINENFELKKNTIKSKIYRKNNN